MKYDKISLIRFGVVCSVYLLWTLWVGEWWLLVWIPVIFDLYVTHKVNWTFWKRRNGKNSKFVEWVDALIFAFVAVSLINIFIFQNYKIPTPSMEKTLLVGDHLYVSKIRFGPKMPNTPLSFPFAQHTMPFSIYVKSYVEWIKWPYKRLAGLTAIKNDDLVVFNFPAGDTVVVEQPNESYYSILRSVAESLKMRDRASREVLGDDAHYMTLGRQFIRDNYTLTIRPVDRRDNYIKRCVAIPGDTLRIVHGQVYINGKPQSAKEHMQYRYAVQTDGSRINPKVLERLGIYADDVWDMEPSVFSIPLPAAVVPELKKLSAVISIQKIEDTGYDSQMFPNDARFLWNSDNYGPLWIPKKGVTIPLDTANVCFYQRLISAYEGHDLVVRGAEILLDGVAVKEYTFAMDYYFMMGDNRRDSYDSRYWGFVPEDHIVGSPRFVWLSLNKEKSFPFNIRWNRFFTPANN